MTYEERNETTPKIARTIVRLMQHHPDEKGLVHAHSYDIWDWLASSPTSASATGFERTIATAATPNSRPGRPATSQMSSSR